MSRFVALPSAALRCLALSAPCSKQDTPCTPPYIQMCRCQFGLVRCWPSHDALSHTAHTHTHTHTCTHTIHLGPVYNKTCPYTMAQWMEKAVKVFDVAGGCGPGRACVACDKKSPHHAHTLAALSFRLTGRRVTALHTHTHYAHILSTHTKHTH